MLKQGTHMEKLIYALIVYTRMLKLYFECHTIEVVMAYQLWEINS